MESGEAGPQAGETSPQPDGTNRICANPCSGAAAAREARASDKADRGGGEGHRGGHGAGASADDSDDEFSEDGGDETMETTHTTAGKLWLQAQAQINEPDFLPPVRSWTLFFMRNNQKRRCPALAELRYELAWRVAGVLAAAAAPALPAGVVREASALVRLYTALRGVAGMKFTEEEVREPQQLVGWIIVPWASLTS